jgi:uncharacterized protein YggT (Ycf19 family)
VYRPPVTFLLQLTRAVWVLVIADALFSWVVPADKFPRSFTKPLLDPVYAPIRRVLTPLTGAVDLSPLVLLALLFVLQRWLVSRGARYRG